jgi:DNA-binding NarL/FixJ family response regulator
VLVDDRPMLLWGLSKLIDGERPRLEVAGTAQTVEEAEQLVQREKPDVVLLDLDLGGQSGLDAMPAILRQAGTRIIILTGTRDPRLREQSMLLGASGILSKEAAADTLVTAITTRACRRSLARRPPPRRSSAACARTAATPRPSASPASPRRSAP